MNIDVKNDYMNFTIHPWVTQFIKKDVYNIGSIVISKHNVEKVLYLFNLLHRQTERLDKWYIHLSESDYKNRIIEGSFKWFLNFFRNVEIVWHKDNSKFNNLSLLAKHPNDYIYVFDEYTYYDIRTIDYAKKKRDDGPVNLSFNEVYDNVHDDFVIKGNLYSLDDYEYEKKFYKDDIACWLKIQSHLNNQYIDNIGINWTDKVYNKDNFDRVLALNTEARNKWKEQNSFIDNSLDVTSFNDLLHAKIDVAYINYNIPEMILENLLFLDESIIKPQDNVYILDVSSKIRYSFKSDYWRQYFKQAPVLIDNTDDAVFARQKPNRDESKYGYALYEQSLKYLIDNCESDYLYVFNCKCLMKKVLFFDETKLMTEYGDYLKIFNIKLMKEKNITFESVKALKTNNESLCEEKSLDDLIVLSEDFDKYNSDALSFIRYRRHMMRKQLKEKYDTELTNDSYWDYI